MLFGIMLGLIAVMLAIFALMAGYGAGQTFLIIFAVIVAIGGIAVCVIAMNGEQKNAAAKKDDGQSKAEDKASADDKAEGADAKDEENKDNDKETQKESD